MPWTARPGTLRVVARSHEALWLAAFAGFTGVATALLVTNATLDAGHPHSAFWTTGFMIGTYVVGLLALICFVGAARQWAVPLTGARPHRRPGVPPQVRAADTSAPLTTEQASEVTEAESSNPVSALPPQGRSAGSATVGLTPPSSPPGPQPKSWRKRVVKVSGFVGSAYLRITADQQASGAEKFLSENADKVPGDIKSELEEAVAELKKALKGTANNAILVASDKLRRVLEKAKIATPKLDG